MSWCVRNYVENFLKISRLSFTCFYSLKVKGNLLLDFAKLTKANAALNRGIKWRRVRFLRVEVSRSQRLPSHPSKSRKRGGREIKEYLQREETGNRPSWLSFLRFILLSRIKLRKVFTRAFTRVLWSSWGRDTPRRGRNDRSRLERDSKGARRGQAWATRDHHDKSSGQTSVQFISL